MRTLDERLDVDPVVWPPKDVQPGEKFLGTVLGVEYRRSDFDPEVSYPVVWVEADDGRELVWYASQTSARRQLERLDPQPGERIGASYRGVGDAKPGQAAPKRFKVIVDRPPGAKPPTAPEPIQDGVAAPPDDDIPF